MNRLQPLAEELFETARTVSQQGDGVTREAYGAGESRVADCLEALARREGLLVSRDRAGSLVIRAKNAAAGPAVWIGSHLDSVPLGGNYDGLAGVVAGILCLVAQAREGGDDSPPLSVIGLRGEEGAWFGRAHLGALALTGMLDAEDLARERMGTGEQLRECMLACGADMEAIEAGRPLFERSHVRAFIELHIEQGPVLDSREVPVAIVPSIRGHWRYRSVTCTGMPGHSGTVPRHLRRDAVFAFSEFAVGVDSLWQEALGRGEDLVVTIGQVGTWTDRHAISRIPGEVSFTLEARSHSEATLQSLHRDLRNLSDRISSQRRVAFQFGERLDAPATTLDAALVNGLEEAAASCGVARVRLPSGAGHDTAVFAKAGIPSAMLFVRNQHGSHNPQEAMRMDDFLKGVQILRTYIAAIAPARVIHQSN